MQSWVRNTKSYRLISFFIWRFNKLKLIFSAWCLLKGHSLQLEVYLSMWAPDTKGLRELNEGVLNRYFQTFWIYQSHLLTATSIVTYSDSPKECLVKEKASITDTSFKKLWDFCNRSIWSLSIFLAKYESLIYSEPFSLNFFSCFNSHSFEENETI